MRYLVYFKVTAYSAWELADEFITLEGANKHVQRLLSRNMAFAKIIPINVEN